MYGCQQPQGNMNVVWHTRQNHGTLNITDLNCERVTSFHFFAHSSVHKTCHMSSIDDGFMNSDNHYVQRIFRVKRRNQAFTLDFCLCLAFLGHFHTYVMIPVHKHISHNCHIIQPDACGRFRLIWYDGFNFRAKKRWAAYVAASCKGC